MIHNYNDDIFILLIAIGLNTLVAIVFKLYTCRYHRVKGEKDKTTKKMIKNPSQEPPAPLTRTHRFLMYLNKSYGYRYLIIMLDNMQLEFLGYCAIHVVYMYAKPEMFAGLFLCLLVVSYYVWATFQQYQSCMRVLKGTFDGSNIIDVILSCYNRKKPWSTLMGIAYSWRCILICSIVVFLIRSPWIQVSLCLFVESIYLCLLAATKGKKNHHENTLDVFNQGFNIVFLILKIVTLANIEEDVRQYTIGLVMTVLIFLHMSMNILYVSVDVVCEVGSGIVEIVKIVVCWKGKKVGRDTVVKVEEKKKESSI